MLSVGVGYPIYNWYATEVPPLAINADWGVCNFGERGGTLSIGALLGFYSEKYTCSFPDYNYLFSGYNFNHFILAPRILYHYNNIPKWELYTGVAIGVELWYSTYYNEFRKPSQNCTIPYPLFVDIKLGARYWIADFLGVYFECGYGLDFVQGGLNFKF